MQQVGQEEKGFGLNRGLETRSDVLRATFESIRSPDFRIPFFFLSFFYTFNEEFFDTRFEEEPLPRTLRNRIFERMEIISAAQFSRCVRLSA